MSFVLPDIVVESVIRDGISEIKAGSERTVSDKGILIEEEFIHTSQSNNQVTIDTVITTTNTIKFILTEYEMVSSDNFPGGLIDGEEFGLRRIGDTDLFILLRTTPNSDRSTLDFGIRVEDPLQPSGFLNAYESGITIEGIVPVAPTSGTGVEITFTTSALSTDIENLVNGSSSTFNPILVNATTYSVYVTLTGFNVIRATSSRLLDMIFDFSGLPDRVAAKYSRESDRILSLINKDDIAVVHSFSEVPARLPCISIQLANDDEDERIALNTDFGGVITDPTNFNRDENVIHANYSLMIGCHTKEPLMTKYLYTLVKYFLLRDKISLESAGMIVPSFRGSDFKRNLEYGGDQVYTRFITMTGKTIDTWVDIDEVVTNIASIGLQTFVGKDTSNVGNSSFGVVGSGTDFSLADSSRPNTNLQLLNYQNLTDRTRCIVFDITDITALSVNIVFSIAHNDGSGTVDTVTTGKVLPFPGATEAEQLEATFNRMAADFATIGYSLERGTSIEVFRLCSTSTPIGAIITDDQSTIPPNPILKYYYTNFSEEATFARNVRNPSDLSLTMTERDQIRITSVDNDGVATVDPGTILGPWMSGSQVIIKTDEITPSLDAETTSISLPPGIVIGSRNLLNMDEFNLRVSNILEPFVQFGDILFDNNGGEVTFLSLNAPNPAFPDDINITVFRSNTAAQSGAAFNLDDTILRLERPNFFADTTYTVKTRPDTILLAGSVLNTATRGGLPSQNNQSGLNKTYTDRSDSNNNDPSPID